MFRVKDSEEGGGSETAEWIVRIALLCALLANLGCDFLILKEYYHLRSALDQHESMRRTEAASLRSEVAVQFAASMSLSIMLAACTAAIWHLRRRHLSNRESLHQVKMLAHDILASMERGVVTTDRDGVVTSINSAAMGLLTVNGECVGRPLASISRADAPLEAVYQDVVHRHATIRDRDLKVDRAGRVLRLRVDGHVLNDAEGAALGCVIHLRDVTEPMLLEVRLRNLERFINLAALASGLHHEIKNPLTALSIHIQLLEEGLVNERAGERVAKHVGVLKTEVRRLNGVLESFRNFANLQHLTIQPTNVLELIESSVRLIRPQAAEQRVVVTLQHSGGGLPAVPLDAEKFGQAVLNLLINALEAMPEGGRLTVVAEVADDELRMSVQDSGPGIPLEIRPNLFQPYFSTKDRGSGMGLALSEKLINQHGGRICFRSGPAGTTFEVAIPVDRENGGT